MIRNGLEYDTPTLTGLSPNTPTRTCVPSSSSTRCARTVNSSRSCRALRHRREKADLLVHHRRHLCVPHLRPKSAGRAEKLQRVFAPHPARGCIRRNASKGWFEVPPERAEQTFQNVAQRRTRGTSNSELFG